MKNVFVIPMVCKFVMLQDYKVKVFSFSQIKDLYRGIVSKKDNRTSFL